MDQPHNLSNTFCFQTFMDGKMNSISKLFGIPLLPLMGKEQSNWNGGTIKCSVQRNVWNFRDETFKVENILRTIVSDGNDAESYLSLSDAEGDIDNDVLDSDQVTPDNIIVRLGLSFVQG